MPSDPILELAIADVVDTLQTMSTAEGYWYDYTDVVEDAVAGWDTAPDLTKPYVYVYWADTLTGGDETGNQQATNRHRHTERVIVEVAVKDETRKIGRALRRIRMDVHKALMADRRRGLSAYNVNTFDAGVDAIDYLGDGGEFYGAVIVLVYHIRWDHQTGDMTAR